MRRVTSKLRLRSAVGQSLERRLLFSVVEDTVFADGSSWGYGPTSMQAEVFEQLHPVNLPSWAALTGTSPSDPPGGYYDHVYAARGCVRWAYDPDAWMPRVGAMQNIDQNLAYMHWDPMSGATTPDQGATDIRAVYLPNIPSRDELRLSASGTWGVGDWRHRIRVGVFASKEDMEEVIENGTIPEQYTPYEAVEQGSMETSWSVDAIIPYASSLVIAIVDEYAFANPYSTFTMDEISLMGRVEQGSGMSSNGSSADSQPNAADIEPRDPLLISFGGETLKSDLGSVLQ